MTQTMHTCWINFNKDLASPSEISDPRAGQERLSSRLEGLAISCSEAPTTRGSNALSRSTREPRSSCSVMTPNVGRAQSTVQTPRLSALEFRGKLLFSLSSTRSSAVSRPLSSITRSKVDNGAFQSYSRSTNSPPIPLLSSYNYHLLLLGYISSSNCPSLISSPIRGPLGTAYHPVVSTRNANSKNAVGGDQGDRILFKVLWAYQPSEGRKMVETRDARALAVNPRYAQTSSGDTETTMPTMPQTTPQPNILSSLPNNPMVRWASIEILGRGSFGEVSFRCENRENKRRQTKPLSLTLS